MNYMMNRLFEVYGREENIKLVAKDMPPLRDSGPQKCLAFSVDGSRFATGGVVSNINIYSTLLCYCTFLVEY